VVNNIRLPGQYFDNETSLHYNYHRYYDPRTGRYLTPDPLHLGNLQIARQNYQTAFIGTLLYQYGLSNPQVLNFYPYCLNDPVNSVDPYGLIVPGVSGAITGAITGVIAGAFTGGAFGGIEGGAGKIFPGAVGGAIAGGISGAIGGAIGGVVGGGIVGGITGAFFGTPLGEMLAPTPLADGQLPFQYKPDPWSPNEWLEDFLRVPDSPCED